ncbi:type II secretion system F family protein [Actinomyces polynesiensis]|uniref:type II secretion system F family protein n=1 Tax=Actinomyces polynesiensis TaxID=1325934 RepID=UPI0006941B54|nr:type II secretion system F family protein [Actinomyces polynesiensis]
MTAVVAAGVCAALLGVLPLLGRWRWVVTVRHWRGDAPPPRGRAVAGEPSGGAGAPHGRGAGVPLSMVVTEVAARLRAGASTPRAWEQAWGRFPGLGPLGGIDGEGVPEGVRRLARRPTWRDCLPRVQAGCGAGSVRDPGPAAVRRPRPVEVLRAGGAPARARRSAARALEAACRFTHHLGAPLAEVLDLVADGIDDAAGAEEARRTAASGPRTSTRVLLALPLLAVGLGEAAGAEPLAFLLGGGVGTLCLLLGVGCQVGGHVVSRILTRRAEGGVGVGVDPAVLCDLAVAGLESGASVPATLEALAAAAGIPSLGRTARELLLGVPWGRAWTPTPEGTEDLGRALEPAWTDGTAPVPLLTRASAHVRARRLARARQEAERLAVRLVVPVAALLLPAFVALGVVPTLVHLASTGAVPSP